MKTSLEHLPAVKQEQLADVVALLREHVPPPPHSGRALGQAEGRAEGKAEGLREGEVRGLRAAVLDLCELFSIELTEERRVRLESMGVSELEALRAALKQTRRWPGEGS
jgi:hypothetical protein